MPQHVVRDPKGYYIMLGVTPTADLAAIKRAYRTRAKLLHPDRNPSPRAAEEFHALNDAYRMLSDPATRLAYDTGRIARDTARPGAPARAAAAADSDTALTPHTCRVCGRATPDLRHLVLHRVRGAGLRVRRAPIRGVFCRPHGERMAVAASLYCWGLGWWALPWGPFATLAALWRNYRGGDMPAAENFQLLTSQARAFLARGNMPLARAFADQVRPFAHTAAERRHLAQLMDALSDQPASKARVRRTWFGPAQLAQLAPFLLIATVALYIAGPTKVITGAVSAVPEAVFTLFTDRTPPEPARPGAPPSTVPTPAMPTPAVPMPAVPESGLQGPFTGRTGPLAPEVPMGGLYTVAPASLAVRAAPDSNARVAGTLSRGTVVMVTEMTRDGAWSRILSARGVSGFVPTTALNANERLTTGQ